MSAKPHELPAGDVWTWPRETLEWITGLEGEDLDGDLSSAEAQRRRFVPSSTVDDVVVLKWAKWSEGEANRYEESGVPVEHADWRFEGGYPVERLVSLFCDRAACAEWFRDECLASIAEERHGYAELLLEEIEDPVVLFELPDGRVDVWGGWHRVAAAIVKGATGIPAVVGMPKPEPVLDRAPRPR